MSNGEVSEGPVVWVPAGDQVVVRFDTGPRAPALWRLRSDRIATPSRMRYSKFRGQSARAVLADEVPPGTRVGMTEEGLDDCGRLVGTIPVQGRGATVAQIMLAETVALVEMSRHEVGGLIEFRYIPGWPSWGMEGLLVVDPTEP